MSKSRCAAGSQIQNKIETSPSMACTDRECSVCYTEEGSFRTLTCGHEFCAGCIKTWYQKGTGTGCPMCRRPIYFKGFHRVRDQWDEDAWEAKCADMYSEAIDAAIEEAIEMGEYFGTKYRGSIINSAFDSIKDIECTLRYLKSRDLHTDDIEYILFETNDYYSDRNIHKSYYDAEDPAPDFVTKYPNRKDGVKGGKRCRAHPDEWCTLNFIIEI